MNANRAAHLRQAHNRTLKFARIGRHDIGKFINDNNDIGHLFGNLRRIRVFCSAFS